jgi:hypothetical protein
MAFPGQDKFMKAMAITFWKVIPCSILVVSHPERKKERKKEVRQIFVIIVENFLNK